MKKITINSPEELRAVATKVAEAETTISMMRDESIAHIYTSDNTMVTKMRKAWYKCTDASVWSCCAIMKSDNDVLGYMFEVPKKVICIRSTKVKSAAKKRVYTEEERKEIGARMHKGLRQKVNNI